jgi:hypothetical protein
MPYEVVNNLRGTSIIRAVDPGTYTITLNNLSSNTDLETVSAANIKRILWSSNGYITIGRGATPTPMLSLSQSGQMKFDELGYSIANTNTGNVVVTIATGGSIVIEMSKIATYSTNLENV